MFHCTKKIDLSPAPEFLPWKDRDVYVDFEDVYYDDVGRYWFDIQCGYQCWEPSWNSSNCRATHNMFIPREITKRLMEISDEKFDSLEQIFYRLDYTMAMAIIDKETVHFKTQENVRCFCTF